jgi:hypothetical protein
MKQLLVLLAVLMLTACQPRNSENPDVVIDSAKENPCIECTKKIQNECIACLAKAGSDVAKQEACKKKASEDWTAKCSLLCKPPKEVPITIEIGSSREAEKTNKPADKTIQMVDFIEGLPILKDACTNGHVRTITVNNTCYNQMCCGGSWKYFVKKVDGKDVYCTCKLGESWTVNCDGNNYIIGCQE